MTTARAVEATKRATRRQAAARTKRRAAKAGFRVSYAGARLGRFAHGYIIVRGRPLAFEPWQLEIYSELLETEHDEWLELTVDDLADMDTLYSRTLPAWMEKAGDKMARRCKCDPAPDGRTSCRRIHREGLIGIGKKNGKSTGHGALALYLTMADGEIEAEVYATAAAREQARVVGRKVRNMVEGSPRLRERLRVQRDFIEDPGRARSSRSCRPTPERRRASTRTASSTTKCTPRRPATYTDVLRSASIERWQPLLASITTAGKSLKQARGGELTIGGELYQRGAGTRPKVKDGRVVVRRDKARSFYFRWHQADPKKVQRRKPQRGPKGEMLPGNLGVVNIDEVLKANPSPRITRAKLEEEAAVERPLAIYLRYHANMCDLG